MFQENTKKTSLALAVGTAFTVSLATVPVAQADTQGNPFGMNDLNQMVVADAKTMEGMCGEGKCGEAMMGKGASASLLATLLENALTEATALAEMVKGNKEATLKAKALVDTLTAAVKDAAAMVAAETPPVEKDEDATDKPSDVKKHDHREMK